MTRKSSLLSIIIPTWNTAEITLRCVNSIRQNLGQSVEIIVVDNNSTDNTQDIFKKNTVKYLKLDKNYGYATACNAGAKIASITGGGITGGGITIVFV